MDPAGLNVFAEQDFLTTSIVRKLLAPVMTRVFIPENMHDEYQKYLAVSLPAKASDFHFPLLSHDTTDSTKLGTETFSPKCSLFVLTFIVHSSLIASHYLSPRGSIYIKLIVSEMLLHASSSHQHPTQVIWGFSFQFIIVIQTVLLLVFVLITKLYRNSKVLTTVNISSGLLPSSLI